MEQPENIEQIENNFQKDENLDSSLDSPSGYDYDPLRELSFSFGSVPSSQQSTKSIKSKHSEKSIIESSTDSISVEQYSRNQTNLSNQLNLETYSSNEENGRSLLEKMNNSNQIDPVYADCNLILGNEYNFNENNLAVENLLNLQTEYQQNNSAIPSKSNNQYLNDQQTVQPNLIKNNLSFDKNKELPNFPSLIDLNLSQNQQNNALVASNEYLLNNLKGLDEQKAAGKFDAIFQNNSANLNNTIYRVNNKMIFYDENTNDFKLSDINGTRKFELNKANIVNKNGQNFYENIIVEKEYIPICGIQNLISDDLSSDASLKENLHSFNNVNKNLLDQQDKINTLNLLKKVNNMNNMNVATLLGMQLAVTDNNQVESIGPANSSKRMKLNNESVFGNPSVQNRTSNRVKKNTNQTTPQKATKPRKKPEPAECELCHRVLASKSSLTLHLRQHTSERPFVCNFCEKSFPRKYSLTRHMKTHKVNQLSNHVYSNDDLNDGLESTDNFLVRNQNNANSSQGITWSSMMSNPDNSYLKIKISQKKK